MIKLLLTNLNILLKLNYYDRTVVGKFKYFVNIDYYDTTMICEFKLF
jgi:hypothetical protein